MRIKKDCAKKRSSFKTATMMMRVESSWFGGVIKVFQLSFSLSLSLFAPRWWWCARAFFYSLSRAAFFLAFISLNFWAIMKDNSIA